jgi:hypothetical protein
MPAEMTWYWSLKRQHFQAVRRARQWPPADARSSEGENSPHAGTSGSRWPSEAASPPPTKPHSDLPANPAAVIVSLGVARAASQPSNRCRHCPLGQKGTVSARADKLSPTAITAAICSSFIASFPSLYLARYDDRQIVRVNWPSVQFFGQLCQRAVKGASANSSPCRRTRFS